MWQPKTQDQSPDPDPNLSGNAGSESGSVQYRMNADLQICFAKGKKDRKV
jgi:hypothetical protein